MRPAEKSDVDATDRAATEPADRITMDCSNGYIVSVQENAVARWGADPEFTTNVYDVRIEDGIMRALLVGGDGDTKNIPGQDIAGGETIDAPGIGTFMLLDVTVSSSVFAPGGGNEAIFCFTPDPDFEVADYLK